MGYYSIISGNDLGNDATKDLVTSDQIQNESKENPQVDFLNDSKVDNEDDQINENLHLDYYSISQSDTTKIFNNDEVEKELEEQDFFPDSNETDMNLKKEKENQSDIYAIERKFEVVNDSNKVIDDFNVSSMQIIEELKLDKILLKKENDSLKQQVRHYKTKLELWKEKYFEILKTKEESKSKNFKNESISPAKDDSIANLSNRNIMENPTSISKINESNFVK